MRYRDTSAAATAAQTRTTEREAPIIGRVFEVQAADELALATDVTPSEASAGVTGRASGAAEEAAPEAASEGAILPFVGRVAAFAPGHSITVERHLTLEEDLYLADHSFVYAPGIKPMSACLPVLPMTMSLEAMAEVAACLVPGRGLIGFEEVKATRWIELADTDVLAVNITSQVEWQDERRGACAVRTAIAIEGQARPAIDALVLFGDRYLVDLDPTFTELDNPYRYPYSAEQVYSERHMFHGPRFQCLSGEIIVAANGIVGEFVVRSPEDLFRSTRDPQLLLDPALLDAVGQIIGLWAMEHDRYAFPIGLDKLELYRPTPPVGTRVPVRVEITQSEGKRLLADVEVQDGAGAVWMRIRGWASWKFRWEKRLVDFRRLPHRYLLAEPAPFAMQSEGAVGSILAAADVGAGDLAMLARFYLGSEEMRIYQGYERIPKRQQEWLLGRIVAKDAVRAWAARQSGAAMLHPAAFTIENDSHGRPFVPVLPGCAAPPVVTIAHSEGRAIAMAHEEPVGVDIERITERDPDFIATFTTARERDLIDRFPDSERHLWSTRLWCAKEAVGKLLGTGVDGAPQELEALAVSSDGRIEIEIREAARSVPVTTIEDRGFVIACTIEARSVPTGEIG